MSKAIELTDDGLLRRMMAGDEDAFTLLYRRRHPAIFRFALHMSGNAALADDVTQEFPTPLYKLYLRAGPHHAPPARPSPWNAGARFSSGHGFSRAESRVSSAALAAEGKSTERVHESTTTREGFCRARTGLRPVQFQHSSSNFRRN
jgi:hypothetical protein